jgi:hypothetical protein
MNSTRPNQPPGVLLRNLTWAFLPALLLCLCLSSHRTAAIDFPGLLREMTDRDAVARVPHPYHECLQASSYNRASTNRNQAQQDTAGWFADSDGLGFVRTDQNGSQTEWVLLDHQGPGCLTKIWTPNFYYGFNDRKGPNVRVYLDDNTSPVVDESLIELVTGKGSFKPPFCAYTARAGNSYLPIPFAKSCRVTLTAKPFYFLINYRAYPEGTPVETFTRAGYQAAAAELEKVAQHLTAPPEAARGAILHSATLEPGGQMEVPLPPGPGALRQFTLRLPQAPAEPEILRSTVLAMTFDGEETVWCPVGDFFCSADTLHPIHTWERTVAADGSLTCRWVMPFRTNGRIRVLNHGQRPVEVQLQAESAPWTWDDRSLHFHARWRPDDVVAGTPFQDWNFVDIRGTGTFVGDAWTILNVQGSWWGEGDEKLYVDKAWNKGFPTHFGTGTEDYYGWAGGEVPTRRDEFSGPFLANARVGGLDGLTTGFNIVTRTRSLDAIPFRERLVFDMESSFGTDIRNPWNLLAYSAVTFWYGKPGVSHNRPAQPAVAAKPILSPEELKAASDRVKHILDSHRDRKAVVFTETRESPLRPWKGLLAAPAVNRDLGAPALEGSARPGEFYAFQIGVYALKDIGPLAIHFSDLRAGSKYIPATAARCLSLGGTNHLGTAFSKQLAVKAGNLQVLWVGIQVPEQAQGHYTGTAEVWLDDAETVPVHLNLRVEGAAVADGGDSLARNLGRLRWLDSTVGSEPALTKPFTAVQVRGRRIKILGREVEIGDDGLPARIRSFFSPANTRVGNAGIDLLARPMAFVVQAGSAPAGWKSQAGRIMRTDLEATWTALSRAGGLRLETAGRLDYTGSGEIRMRLTAEQDMELRHAHLDIPFREEASRYFMGLNHQGGLRPEEVRWKWDVGKRQDCFWLGEVNAGLMIRLKDADYLRPPVNIYYSFRPLRTPVSWDNNGHGGVDIGLSSNRMVLARAYSGPRTLKQGEALDFVFELYVTPFRTLDTKKQWAVRFTHVGGHGRETVDQALASADAQRGPNVLNVHHASFYSPYINYPYSDDSFPAFCDLVRRAHDKGVKLRVYYTTREITQNMPELFPLHTLSGEVILPGPGREAKTLIHPHGPHGWLTENLRGQFIPAWEAQVGTPYADLDLSVLTNPDSRWNNFYLEGLRWLAEKSDFDGMYIDDTALDATSLRRARRILDARPGRLIDLHTWNHFNQWAGFANNLTIYMEILPYVDRLWLGEGFDANAATPNFWLVEMSGLPFGLMSEMLDGANPWRGMVFGETARLPWSGDPRGSWKVWDEFGLQGTEMLPFFVKNCPVQTGLTNVLATVYRKPGRSFIALGSWAAAEQRVGLSFDWKALGFDPKRARLYAPPIKDLQPERSWKPGDLIPVAPKRGWFLVLDEIARPAPVATTPSKAPPTP